jgi:hypothetical protein
MEKPDSIWISRLIRASWTAAIVLGVVAPAGAQSEDALKVFFEGKRVITRIDMPGTSDGVDVNADARRAIDYPEYGDRLKTYGTAIRSGDSVVVTLVKVKKDLIEFQLGGGGFGTFSDDTSTSVNIPSVEKSSRERELEKRIKNEDNDRRRRQLEEELDDLRHRRERENRRIEAQRVAAEELKKERIAEKRLRGGSRFNIRYAATVPQPIGPAEVMAALAEYVDFSSLGGASVSGPHTAAFDSGDPGSRGDLQLRKGMMRQDADRMFGPALQSSTRREGNLTLAVVVFERGDERISADFVDDVLVHYVVSSK